MSCFLPGLHVFVYVVAAAVVVFRLFSCGKTRYFRMSSCTRQRPMILYFNPEVTTCTHQVTMTILRHAITQQVLSP